MALFSFLGIYEKSTKKITKNVKNIAKKKKKYNFATCSKNRDYKI